jgi:hypothetical protein
MITVASFFSHIPYHWRLPSLPSCRGDDVMQTPVPWFDVQVL